MQTDQDTVLSVHFGIQLQQFVAIVAILNIDLVEDTLQRFQRE